MALVSWWQSISKYVTITQHKHVFLSITVPNMTGLLFFNADSFVDQHEDITIFKTIIAIMGCGLAHGSVQPPILGFWDLFVCYQMKPLAGIGSWAMGRPQFVSNYVFLIMPDRCDPYLDISPY